MMAGKNFSLFMSSVISKENPYEKKTLWGVIYSSLLSEPLFTIYGFIALILRKNLDATAFQIAVLTMLKPFVSILSFYWSSHLSKKPHKLRANFLGAGLLQRLPFLFVPLIHSSWYLIFAAAIYLLFYRAGTPAWMQILKINLPKEKRQSIFSWGFALGYVEGMVLALGVGSLLDVDHGLWKMFFFWSAIIGMVNLYFLSRLPINQDVEIKEVRETWKETVQRPWKNCYRLMKTRPDFSRFQWGFMLAGFGIMLVQPAIILFFADTIKISYAEFGIANTICKGVFIAASSPIWSRLMNKMNLFSLSSIVFVLVGLQPFFLLFSETNALWIYLAFIFYGIAQGGSHLIWHMSGPIFSGDEDSSIYSGVNVVMVGVRGLIAPALGGFLSVLIGPLAVMLMGASLCFYSGYYLFRRREVLAIS